MNKIDLVTKGRVYFIHFSKSLDSVQTKKELKRPKKSLLTSSLDSEANTKIPSLTANGDTVTRSRVSLYHDKLRIEDIQQLCGVIAS